MSGNFLFQVRKILGKEAPFFPILFFLFNTATGSLSSIDHWETVIYSNQTWSYYIGTSEPSLHWRELTFDDSSWLRGIGGIGYGDEDDSTSIEPCTALYLRINFTIFDTSKIEKAILHVDYDDGFVAYINDVEVARANIGVVGDHPPYDETTLTDHEAVMYAGGVPEGFRINRQILKGCLNQGNNVLAMQIHNVSLESSDLSSTTFLSVGINDSTTAYHPTPEWFIMYEDLASNLPIIVINTHGEEIPDEPKIVAEMGIINGGPGGRNALDDPFSDYDGRITIEIRGNTAQMFPKKAYALETQNANGDNNNVSLLGMPAENDWILYAPYSDKSLMRNVLTFKLANDIGRYAPRTRFCELILNDDYRGIYVLMEKIKRDRNRVDIAELEPEDTQGDQLTGGYVVQINWDEEGRGWFSSISGTNFHYHHPQQEDLVPVQREYIKNFITEFESVLEGPDYRDPNLGYRRYIDVSSFVDYIIGCELGRNSDSYRISTFMYKDRDSRDGELHMGPQWDFNLAYGNQDEGGFGEPYHWSWDPEYELDPINFWWERLRSDPAFSNQLVARWEELREDILARDRILDYIDSVALVLDEAQQRNYERWPILGEHVWPNSFVGETYQEEVDFLKNWITRRLEWIDENLPEIQTPSSPSEVFALHHNYPNPFNTFTTIDYDLGRDVHVKLVIYDLLGRAVTTLVDRREEKGHKTVTWNGVDQSGRRLSSGVYLYEIRTGRWFTKSTKMLFLK